MERSRKYDELDQSWIFSSSTLMDRSRSYKEFGPIVDHRKFNVDGLEKKLQ